MLTLQHRFLAELPRRAGLAGRFATAADQILVRRLIIADADQLLSPVPPAVRTMMAALRAEYRPRQHPPAVRDCLLFQGDQAVALLQADWSRPGHIHVLEMIVHPDHRGRGLGGAVLSLLCDVAGGGGRAVTTELFYDSRARRLLQRLGFRIVAERGMGLRLEWAA